MKIINEFELLILSTYREKKNNSSEIIPLKKIKKLWNYEEKNVLTDFKCIYIKK